VPMIETENEFPQPTHYSEPIAGLYIQDIFKCNDCDFLTRNQNSIRRHTAKNHKESRPGLDSSEKQWQSVKAQQWVRSWSGAKYWIVRADTPLSTPINGDVIVLDNVTSPKSMSWEDRMEQLERDRLQKQNSDMMRVTCRNDIDDTTPWLLRTKWPQTFHQKNLRLLGRTRYSDLDRETRAMFPHWTECRTRLIATEFNKVVIRAVLTLDQTSQSLCSWLRSSRRNEPSRRPFCHLQRRGMEQKYASQWKQFLYYCLRIFQLDPATREQQYGAIFTAEQLRCLTELDEMLDEALSLPVECDKDRID
jgi:Orsellinic acid/F9775 biosynthesis cluster protein D